MIYRKYRVKRSIPRKISNGIIAFFITIFSIIVILFGFTQTSTFRNMLREQILELSKSSLNGKLSIGEVDGTLITQLVLKDVSLSMKSDTLIVAKQIEIALNPFYILSKKIKVTKFDISQAKIKLFENKDKSWNIQNIVRHDTVNVVTEIDSTIVEETKEKQFPFLFDISNIDLNNITFTLKKYQFRNNFNIIK